VTPSKRELGGQAARFLASGTFNTLATYALYCALVAFMHPQIAYAIVFALGIVVAYLLNARFVFRSPLRVSSARVYPLVYLGQYALNALLIGVLTGIGAGPRIALALALALVTPLSFALNRIVLTGGASKGGR
jgi:putative flippase GtrA